MRVVFKGGDEASPQREEENAVKGGLLAMEDVNIGHSSSLSKSSSSAHGLAVERLGQGARVQQSKKVY